MRERHNSCALAMELRLSCINPWISYTIWRLIKIYALASARWIWLLNFQYGASKILIQYKHLFLAVEENPVIDLLTHWVLETHNWVSKLGRNFGSGNGLLADLHHTITRTNTFTDLLSIGPLEKTSVKFSSIRVYENKILSRKCIWKRYLQNVGHFIKVSISWLFFLNDEINNTDKMKDLYQQKTSHPMRYTKELKETTQNHIMLNQQIKKGCSNGTALNGEHHLAAIVGATGTLSCSRVSATNLTTVHP